MDDSDQAQKSEPNESDVVDNTSEDNQEVQEEGQSNKDEKAQEGESKLFKDSFGRDLTADQLYEEYSKMIPEFTRRTERLKELEELESSRKAEADARVRSATDDILKDVPADVKEAVIKIVEPLLVEREERAKENARQEEIRKEREEADKALQNQLSDLENKYDGKNPEYLGIPKFNRAEVLEAMRDESNKIYDPEVKFMQMHQAKFLDLEIKRALKRQSGGNKTESTGSGGGTTPAKSNQSVAKTIREASERFLSRMNSSE